MTRVVAFCSGVSQVSKAICVLEFTLSEMTLVCSDAVEQEILSSAALSYCLTTV